MSDSKQITSMGTRKWTEQEVDGLVFRLLQKTYKSDKKIACFLIEQLRGQLLKELT